MFVELVDVFFAAHRCFVRKVIFTSVYNPTLISIDFFLPFLRRSTEDSN